MSRETNKVATFIFCCFLLASFGYAVRMLQDDLSKCEENFSHDTCVMLIR